MEGDVLMDIEEDTTNTLSESNGGEDDRGRQFKRNQKLEGMYLQVNLKL